MFIYDFSENKSTKAEKYVDVDPIFDAGDEDSDDD
jgi:hypothetical protein